MKKEIQDNGFQGTNLMREASSLRKSVQAEIDVLRNAVTRASRMPSGGTQTQDAEGAKPSKVQKEA